MLREPEMFLHTRISKSLLNVSFKKLLKPTGKFLSVLLFAVSALTSLVLFFFLSATLRNYAWIKRFFLPFIWPVLKQFILLQWALCKPVFSHEITTIVHIASQLPDAFVHTITQFTHRTAMRGQAKRTCSCSAERSTAPERQLAWGRLGFSRWNRSQIVLGTNELLFIQHMQHRQQRGWLPLPYLKLAFGGNCLQFSFYNRCRPCFPTVLVAHYCQLCEENSYSTLDTRLQE